MEPPAVRTLAATVAAAAMLAAAAAQLHRLPLLGESHFALLALFFVVGAGTAWVAVRMQARATPRRPAAGHDVAVERERGQAEDVDNPGGGC